MHEGIASRTRDTQRLMNAFISENIIAMKYGKERKHHLDSIDLPWYLKPFKKEIKRIAGIAFNRGIIEVEARPKTYPDGFTGGGLTPY